MVQFVFFLSSYKAILSEMCGCIMDDDKTTNFTIKSIQYEIVFIYKMWSCGLDQIKVDLQHWANFLLESFEYFSKKFIWEKQIPS